MNKSILWLIGLLFVTSLSIVSCSETDGTEDPTWAVHERSGVPIPSPHWNPGRDWALVKRVPKVNDRVNNNVLLFICSYF